MNVIVGHYHSRDWECVTPGERFSHKRPVRCPPHPIRVKRNAAIQDFYIFSRWYILRKERHKQRRKRDLDIRYQRESERIGR